MGAAAAAGASESFFPFISRSMSSSLFRLLARVKNLHSNWNRLQNRLSRADFFPGKRKETRRVEIISLSPSTGGDDGEEEEEKLASSTVGNAPLSHHGGGFLLLS
jgi:hypothetical protein